MFLKKIRIGAAILLGAAAIANSGQADDGFQILSPLSLTESTPDNVFRNGSAKPEFTYDDTGLVLTAAQQVAPPPPDPAGNTPIPQAPGTAQMQPAVPQAPTPIFADAANGPMCVEPGCGPGGPLVAGNNWGSVWGPALTPVLFPANCYYGFETTHLWVFDEPHQDVVLTDLVTDQTYRGQSDPGLGHGFRTWIGAQAANTGVRVRYWYFREENLDTDPWVPIKAEPAFIEAHNLEAQTLDFEVTQQFPLCWSVLNTSFGARYARLRRNASVSGFGTVGNDLVDLNAIALGANQTDGVGFTASIGCDKPLFDKCNPCCPTGLFFFWNFRGSVLWGDNVVSAYTEASAFTKQPAAAAAAHSQDSAFSTMAKDTFQIYDLQVGFHYDWVTCWCPGVWSMRGGLEYQHWETGDLFAQSNSFAFLDGAVGPTPFGGRADASSNGTDGDLDLIGVFWGLQWSY